MPEPQSIEEIVASGMCSGCGLCASLTGSDAIEMRVTADGRMRPDVRRPLTSTEVRRVLDVCPGVEVAAPEPEGGTSVHPVWGPIRTVDRTWAADPRVRHHAAAGGTLTALGQYLLRTGEVDAVLHVKASRSQPLLTDAQVSRTADEVRDGAQSRYGPAAPLVHVHRLLDEGIRFAVIAKPCDISALRRLGRQDPRVERQIPYMLTLFCGGVPTLQTAERIAGHLGFDAEDVSVFRWRGEGWPGATHVEARDGRSAELSYEAAWYDPDVPWTYDIQFRCKVCPDAIGEAADISCPDGWHVENGQRVLSERPGRNLAITRTTAGDLLLGRAVADGALEAERSSVDEIEAMHGDHLPRKLEHPARLLALRLARRPAVRARGFRPVRMVVRLGPRGTMAAFLGTMRRVRAGGSRE